ncbi:erv26 super protein [Kickxella alabastrina]|uniref:Erv26 super protein n=1 Tax=Kickxella alabastrina TaxID=61397 RepID=A0ACC1HZN1_9FUNG|nr:erv26 super protein [Kickxella alabastrina]
MALVLSALSTIGWAAGLVFGIFSLACGLYVTSEWVEEYPRQARKAIQLSTWAIDALLLLALLDGTSIWRTLVTLATNHVYMQNLTNFPLVNLSGPVFLGSCILAVGNHFLWFFYFIKWPGILFGEVCAFMFFCVWLVPLALFVSLTPVDAALPSSREAGTKRVRQNMFKTMFSKFVRSEEQPQLLHNE